MLSFLANLFFSGLSSKQEAEVGWLLYAHLFENASQKLKEIERRELLKMARATGRVGFKPPSLDYPTLIKVSDVMMDEVRKRTRQLRKDGKVRRYKVYTAQEILAIISKGNPIPVYYRWGFPGAPSKPSENPDLQITYEMIKKGPSKEADQLQFDRALAMLKGYKSRKY